MKSPFREDKNNDTPKKERNSSKDGNVKSKMYMSKKDVIHVKKNSVNMHSSTMFDMDVLRKKENKTSFKDDPKIIKKCSNNMNKTIISDNKDLKGFKKLVKGINLTDKHPKSRKSDNHLKDLKINYKNENKSTELDLKK